MVDTEILNKLDDNIFDKCKDLICEKFGDLDDIPHEVANTIANCYYHYYQYIVEYDNSPGGWIPNEVKSESDLGKGLKNFVENTTMLKFAYEEIPKFIAKIRKIKNNDERLMFYELFLDIFKYNIDYAHKKIGLRLMIERKIKKKNVNEIPNLIDLLDV